MNFRPATLQDAPVLAQLNYQLIQDEGHINPMTVAELAERMRQWLATSYQGIIFEDERGVVAYAVYQEEPAQIYLRQFFVVRERRRASNGRNAMKILFSRVWPRNKRLTVSSLFHNQRAIAFWKAVGYAEFSITLEIPPGP